MIRVSHGRALLAVVLIAAFGLLASACARSPEAEREPAGAEAGDSSAVAADSMRAALLPDTDAIPGIDLPPEDGAARVPGLVAFRQGLVAAVARRDTATLMAAIDPAIKCSFGGDDGSAAFRRLWFGADSIGDIWSELGSVLALGGTMVGDSQFIAPYTYSTWPQDLDPFEHMAVIDSGVIVRDAPSADAAPLGTLGRQIVRIDPNGSRGAGADGWVAIDRGPAGRGYVVARAVRSPVDYRAFFQRKGGRWRMTLLVAGD